MADLWPACGKKTPARATHGQLDGRRAPESAIMAKMWAECSWDRRMGTDTPQWMETLINKIMGYHGIHIYLYLSIYPRAVSNTRGKRGSCPGPSYCCEVQSSCPLSPHCPQKLWVRAQESGHTGRRICGTHWQEELQAHWTHRSIGLPAGPGAGVMWGLCEYWIRGETEELQVT